MCCLVKFCVENARQWITKKNSWVLLREGPTPTPREAQKTPSWPLKHVPVVFVFLLVNYFRKHLGFRDLSHFWGVCNFLHFESFLMGISMGQFPDIEFAYYGFKSGKWIKQTPTPAFWGDVDMKKWSQILDSGTQSPIFGHLKMGTFPQNGHF